MHERTRPLGILSRFEESELVNMSVNDPVSDMLIRIQNAARAKHNSCVVPFSKLNHSIALLLVREGYIQDVELIERERKKDLRVHLKYIAKGIEKEPPFSRFHRVSKPGRRIYCSWREIPRVLSGLGIAVVSTSEGVLTDREARKIRRGGELLFTVW